MPNPRRSLPLLPSASRLAGAAVCVAPWSLELPRRETTSEAAEWGRLCHAGAEALAEGETQLKYELIAKANDSRFERILDHAQAAIDADGEAWSPNGAPHRGPWLVEQGIRYRRAFPLDEAELCERVPGQEERGWFSGTADLVYVRADSVLVVVDWKFGHLTERIGDPAEEHWQLWMLALAFATYLGIDLSDGSRVVARVELRHVGEEGCRVDGVDVTAGELVAFAASLAEIQERIEAGEGPRIGQACGRCSARHACDAYQGMPAKAIEAITGAAPSSPLFELPKTPEEAVALYRMLDAAKKALPLVEDNVKTWLRANGDLDLGMGQKLRAKASQSARVVNTPEAIAAAAAALGVEAAKFTKPRMTKALLKKAWAEASGKKRSGKDAKAVEQEWVERGFLASGAARTRVVIARTDGTEVNAWKEDQDEDDE